MSDLQAEELIEKFFDGTLAQAERKRLDDWIAATPGIEHDIEEVASLRRLLADNQPEAFAPGFVGAVLSSLATVNDVSARFDPYKTWNFRSSFLSKVMQAVREEIPGRTSSANFELDEGLGRLFPKLAVPCFAVACVAAILNVHAAPPEAPLLDKLIGLQSVNAQPLNPLDFNQE